MGSVGVFLLKKKPNILVLGLILAMKRLYHHEDVLSKRLIKLKYKIIPESLLYRRNSYKDNLLDNKK